MKDEIIKLDSPLSCSESRLYIFVLKTIKKHYQEDDIKYLKIDESDVTIKIDRLRFLDILSNQYVEPKRLNKALSSLYNTYIRIEEPCEDGAVKLKRFRLFTLCLYDKDNDKYKISIPRTIFDISIRNNSLCSIDNLSYMNLFECMYSFRLYELLIIRNDDSISITKDIAFLKDWFGVSDKKSYSTYANFKNKVIYPAIEDINKLDWIKVSMNEIKYFGKVDSLEFILSKK